jgi:hypothetical protein
VKDRAANSSAFGDISGRELARLGRFAGVLMIVGALVSIPAGLVLDPAPEAAEHLIGVGLALVGVIALLAPWERMSPNWIHVGLIVVTAEIAAGVAVISDDYAFFFVLVSMYAAYVIRDRTVLVAYMLFFTLAIVAPIIYANDDLSNEAHHILVTLPVFLIAAAIVRYLRDTLEVRERQYRGFAVEAVSLAERIRGGHPADGDDEDLEARLGRLAAGEANRGKEKR